jgi:hypothetical protein
MKNNFYLILDFRFKLTVLKAFFLKIYKWDIVSDIMRRIIFIIISHGLLKANLKFSSVHRWKGK